MEILKITKKTLGESLSTSGAMMFGLIQGTLKNKKLIIKINEVHKILLENQDKEEDFEFKLKFKLNKNEVYRLGSPSS
jgi:hypothetical protein